MTKLDVELVARRCLPELLMGQPVSDETKDQVRADLDKGMKAFDRLFMGDPWAAGKTFGLADFYTFYSLGLAGTLAKTVVGVDLLEGRDALQALLAKLAERPSIARVSAEAAG